jgi:hypothetical protein
MRPEAANFHFLANRTKSPNATVACTTAHDVAEAANPDISQGHSMPNADVFGKLASIGAIRERQCPKAADSALQLWPSPQTPPEA